MSQIEVDKVIPQSGTALQVGDSGDTITIPAGATITNNGTANGFGSADTEKVKVSSNDTTAGFLNGKLVSGTNISLTEGNDGGNETLTAALSGTISTAQIGANQVTGAKLNNDVISAQTELAAEPADTDELLVSDAGVLKRVDYSHIKGAGKVLQVISVSKNDTFTTTSTSFVDVTGLTADITPSSTSNKVLVTVFLGRLVTDDGGGFGAELNRGGSSIYDLGQGNLSDCFATGGGGGMSNNDRKNDVAFIQYLDSPSSSSTLTYKIRVKRSSAGSGYINRWGLNDDQGCVSSITLMEIAG